MPNNTKSKYWCFTLNNYSEEQWNALASLHPQEVSYLIMGKEVAESGTRHIQGYLELSQRKRFSTCKQLLPQQTHLEKRLGSALQASTYCKKEGSFQEYGDLSQPEQGRRTDLEELHDSLKQKRSLEDISDSHFSSFVKYQKGIHSYRQIHGRKRQWATTVHALVGPTGTGKTRLAHLKGGHSLWIADQKLSWFDGYDEHDYVLFDEFSGSTCDIKWLLRLLDRYPMQVQVKGSYVQWSPKVIFICSNIPVEQWYPNAREEHQAALMRRLNSVIEFDESTFNSMKYMPF